MFKKKKDKLLFFETKNYQMAESYPTSNLMVGNLEYISNQEDLPTIVTTDQKYLFETFSEDGHLKYREIFTGFVTGKEEDCIFFNLPYVTNAVPLSMVLDNPADTLPKYSLLLVLDEVNQKEVQINPETGEISILNKDRIEDETETGVGSVGVQKQKHRNEVKKED